MTYQVLARKWRPRTFQDMVGQTTVLRMLCNAINQQRLHHAYLFTGTRGVGKTTLARIFAKCLNCETQITINPCDQCQNCLAINAGKFIDLYEIDAASRTKVEDTRELLENVLYPPNQGRYKIYLIDEVHMLSNHSFNALLKTLEEPPAHVKFLLATTEIKRIPITILSRCLQFHLTRIPSEQIQQRLAHICTTEKITYEDKALQSLAQAADGSMRDSLSLLDQAIAYGQQHLTEHEVNTMLGHMPQQEIIPLLEALANQDGNALLAAITKLNEHALDSHQILATLITSLHQLAITQVVPAHPIDANLSPFITRFTPEDIQLYYQIALLGRRDLELAPTPEIGFEMTMLRLLAFKFEQHIITTESTVNSPITPSPTLSIPQPTIHPAVTTNKEVTPSNLEWRDLLPKLELSGMAYALAANCKINEITDKHCSLALSIHHQPMLNEKLKERIAEALTRYFKQPIKLEIQLTTEDLLTPLKQKQHEEKQELLQAKQKVMQDPQVQTLIEMYDATIEITVPAC